MRRDYSYPLRVAADKYADRVAFVYRDATWTFRDFDAATDRLAAAFERRGLAGQRVALLPQNDPATVMTYLALARAGAIAVPVNPRLLLNELVFVVDDCAATTIVSDVAFAENAAELLAACPAVERVVMIGTEAGATEHERFEDLVEEPGTPTGGPIDPFSEALVVYTSGTSGVPKGVARTHDANLWATVNNALGQPRSIADTEVFVLPLFGIAFIFQVMPMILSGGTVVLDGAFDPVRTWDLLERHRATRIFLAPTMISSMLGIEGHEARDVSSLTVLNTAYEFPDRVRDAAAARFGPIVAYMYGLTEAQLCCSTPAQFAADPSDAGHAMGMMRVRIVDDEGIPVANGETGEITMEGPTVMTGYLGREESTAEVLRDGWLSTGDLGFLDAEGRVHVVGRKKAMIKTGGFSVDPVEVENAILAFPGIQEAAVVGVPDEHWGEQIVAFVASAPGAETSEGDLLVFVKSQIAGFKCPKRVWFIAEIPKNPTGKIERARLRAQAVERAAS